MSTKAIREVLGEAGFRAPDTCDEAMARKVAAAWAEVEAIERAAKDIADNGSIWAKDESMDLIQAIAEQD